MRVFNPNVKRYMQSILKQTPLQQAYYASRTQYFYASCHYCNWRNGMRINEIYSRLAEQISEMRKSNYCVAATYTGRKITFVLIKSIGLSQRQSISVSPVKTPKIYKGKQSFKLAVCKSLNHWTIYLIIMQVTM